MYLEKLDIPFWHGSDHLPATGSCETSFQVQVETCGETADLMHKAAWNASCAGPAYHCMKAIASSTRLFLHPPFSEDRPRESLLRMPSTEAVQIVMHLIHVSVPRYIVIELKQLSKCFR